MYLEKLEVQGFKSFANKNKLIFSGLINDQKRGLTAIVGPNGSGKSNVADSIRWVLGEQSLKTLRGKKSEDVIFSGSDKKNQLSMAEVSLYLNNSEAEKNNASQPEKLEKESDLDQLILSCSEIVVTRRLYRNGDSEYLLNGNRVRLTDIQMLLAKANFGQKTYSVIGQGMVENFLSSSAADRKDFFDEATGVKQFQIKRDSALNKVESSYENLQQVDMLLTEIKPRLKSLTRQVEKLKKREEIEKNLLNNQLDYYGFLWHEINKKLDGYNHDFLENEKIQQEQENKLNKLNEELNKIRTTNNFQEINELQPRLKELEAQKNQLNKQLAKLQAELEVQLESKGQFDVSWLENKKIELESNLKNINAEISSLNLGKSNEDEPRLRSEIALIDKEIEKCYQIKREINQCETEKDQYAKQINKLEAVLEANLEVQGKFDVSWLNNKHEELKIELNKIDKEIIDLDSQNNFQEKSSLEEKINAVKNRLEKLNKELDEINKNFKKNGASEDQNKEISRLIDEFLKKLDAISQETDLHKVKKLISEAKDIFQEKIKSLIIGENSQALHRIKEIQDEIIVLTDQRQNLNNQLGEERLRLSTVSERLRLFQEKKTQILRELDDIKAKLAKAETKFEAGELEKEKAEILKKIKQVETNISELYKSYHLQSWLEKKQKAADKLQEYRLKSSSLEERLRLITNQKLQIEREIVDISSKLAKSQTKFDATGIEKEKQEINNRLSIITNESENIENKLQELNQAKEKEKSLLFEYQKNIQSLQTALNEISLKTNSLRIEATRQETKLEDLENNIRNDNLNIKDIKEHEIEQLPVDINFIYKKLNDNKNQLEQIGGIDPEAEKEYEETKNRFDFLNGQTNDLNSAIKSLEEIIYELDANIKNRFDSEFKVISEKFNDYFKILFNGGSAKITKLLAEDIEKEEDKNTPSLKTAIDNLNSGLSPVEVEMKNQVNEKLKRIKFLKKHNAVGLAGIDIQATPPGKKIQTVTMLSGGERALTAIALICAIISANPSPFVVLDEVDAALDESNSERLAKILDDLSNKTQFIVITHNRACMKRASILYGVTMEADGVSKLLSVKIDENKQ